MSSPLQESVRSGQAFSLTLPIAYTTDFALSFETPDASAGRDSIEGSTQLSELQTTFEDENDYDRAESSLLAPGF
jgi:hypothetical protein